VSAEYWKSRKSHTGDKTSKKRFTGRPEKDIQEKKVEVPSSRFRGKVKEALIVGKKVEES